MSTANVTQTGVAATVAVTVSRGLQGATGEQGPEGETTNASVNTAIATNPSATRTAAGLVIGTDVAAASHTHTIGDLTAISSGKLVGRHAGSTGTGQEITIDGGLTLQGANLQRSALTGDVTADAGSNSTTISNDTVTNAKLANMATATIKGRTSSGTGDPEDLTALQARDLIGALSSETGFRETFEDIDRWADGAAITHNVTTPEVGRVYHIHVPGGNTAPTVVHANKGLTPSNGAGLFYLGSIINSPGKKVSLGFEVTPVATDAISSGAKDFGLNISLFPDADALPASGGIAPDGIIHINMDSAGVSIAELYNGDDLECHNATASGGYYPWSSTQSTWPTGIRQRIIYEVEGNYLRITCVGRGSLLFFHPDLSDQIGAATSGFWIEPSGTEAAGGVSNKRKIVIHRITDNPAELASPSWNPQDSNGRFNIINVVTDGTSKAKINNGTFQQSSSLPALDFSYIGGSSGTKTYASGVTRPTGGLHIFENLLTFNAGLLEAGGQQRAIIPGNISSGVVAPVSSAAASSVTTLWSAVNLRGMEPGDMQEFEAWGRLVGPGAKRIIFQSQTYAVMSFDSNLSGTPLDAVEGYFHLRVMRIQQTSTSNVMYATFTYNGTVLPIQYVSSNTISTNNENWRLRATTADAGGVVLDIAKHTCHRVILI